MSLDRLDSFRRSVSFKWWLVYDVLIATGMVVLFRSLDGWALLLPVALAVALAFSAALDVIEFFVKRRMERDVDEFLAAQDREAKARKR
jgi:uncharacterized membrane protein YjdF